MTDWHIGDLAECVDARPQDGDHLATTGLVPGDVYTVADVLNDSGKDDRCAIGLTFEEISPFGGRIGWCADRFRKVSA